MIEDSKLCLSPHSVSLSWTASFVCLLTALVMSVGAEWDGVGVSILYVSPWMCASESVNLRVCVCLMLVCVAYALAPSPTLVCMAAARRDR